MIKRYWELILLIVMAAIMATFIKIAMPNRHNGYPDQDRAVALSPIRVATHRYPLSNGFILMFDSPITYQSDLETITVLGIGRAKLPFLAQMGYDRSYPSHLCYEARVHEKMLILLKVAVRQCRVCDISYASASEYNETKQDWRSDLFYGAHALELPLGLSRSFLRGGDGARVQVITCNLPPKNLRILGDDMDTYDSHVYPHALVIRLGDKPDVGPMPVADMQAKTLHLDQNLRIHLFDWVIDNPALLDMPSGAIAKRMLPEGKRNLRYLSLRFGYASKTDYYGPNLFALVYGAKGEKLLLREIEQEVETTTPKGYLGMEFTYTSMHPARGPWRSHVVSIVDPSGPAAKAGIRVGDRIIENGNSPATSYCIQQNTPCVGLPLTLMVARNGSAQKVTIIPAETADTNPLYKGKPQSSMGLYEEMLKGIPYAGNSSAGIKVIGGGTIGRFRLTSNDPVPADFRPVKVCLFVEKLSRSRTVHQPQAPGRASDICLELPNIPIPAEFWK